MLRLVFILSLKDFKQRYHGRRLRAAWTVINPLFYIAAFTLIFSRFIHLDSEGAPYPLFVFSALIPWIFFSSCLSFSCYSLIFNRDLILRFPFPRMAVPLASVTTNLIDFVISFLLFFVLFLLYRGTPSPALWYIAPILLVEIILVFGMSLLLSISHAYLRDVGSGLPILLQAWMLASPVVYSTGMVSEKYRVLYFLNPMAGVIDGFRRILLHGQPPDPAVLATSFQTALLVFGGGLLVFKKLERNLPDVV